MSEIKGDRQNETAARWWVSKFELPDGRPSFCEMWGTEEEVRRIALRRAFHPPKRRSGPVKEMRPSIWASLFGLDRPDVMHSTCYLGFLAARSGVVTAEELVRDGSALHELSHYLSGVRTYGGRRQEDVVIDAMRRLEEMTPGVPPPEVEIPLP